MTALVGVAGAPGEGEVAPGHSPMPCMQRAVTPQGRGVLRKPVKAGRMEDSVFLHEACRLHMALWK